VVAAQVDRAAHAVVVERLPAAFGQPRKRVGAHDDAELRLAAVHERQATDVTHVHAAVPDQDALARQGADVPSRP
jgi:hypothetical protein